MGVMIHEAFLVWNRLIVKDRPLSVSKIDNDVGKMREAILEQGLGGFLEFGSYTEEKHAWNQWRED